MLCKSCDTHRCLNLPEKLSRDDADTLVLDSMAQNRSINLDSDAQQHQGWCSSTKVVTSREMVLIFWKQMRLCCRKENLRCEEVDSLARVIRKTASSQKLRREALSPQHKTLLQERVYFSCTH